MDTSLWVISVDLVRLFLYKKYACKYKHTFYVMYLNTMDRL